MSLVQHFSLDNLNLRDSCSIASNRWFVYQRFSVFLPYQINLYHQCTFNKYVCVIEREYQFVRINICISREIHIYCNLIQIMLKICRKSSFRNYDTHKNEIKYYSIILMNLTIFLNYTIYVLAHCGFVRWFNIQCKQIYSKIMTNKQYV